MDLKVLTISVFLLLFAIFVFAEDALQVTWSTSPTLVPTPPHPVAPPAPTPPAVGGPSPATVGTPILLPAPTISPTSPSDGLAIVMPAPTISPSTAVVHEQCKCDSIQKCMACINLKLISGVFQ